MSYRDTIYALEWVEDPRVVNVRVLREGNWDLDLQVSGLVEGIRGGEWVPADAIGQSAVVGDVLYSVFPSTSADGAVLKKDGDDWSAHASGRAFRGPIGGVLT